MRIGELARAVGTTTRTIRYYEECGLMPGSAQRQTGAHRTYSEEDAQQLREILRLRGLLGVSLDGLRDLVAAQDVRLVARAEIQDPSTTPERRLELLEQLSEIVERTQELADQRRQQLDELDAELQDRRERIASRKAELSDGAPASKTSSASSR